MTDLHVMAYSGGGARGAFHGGVTERLLDRGIVPEGYAGVSTGALIAGFMAAHSRYRMPRALSDDVLPVPVYEALHGYRDIWFGLRKTSDVYRGGLLRAGWNVLRGKNAIGDLEPLRELIERHMPPPGLWYMEARRRVRLGRVDLYSGHELHNIYHSAGEIETSIRPYYLRAMLASSSIPVTAPPVNMEVDGGVRTVAPLAQAIKLGKSLDPDGTRNLHVHLSIATPTYLADVEGRYDLSKDWGRAKVWEVGLRALDLMAVEGIRNDVAGCFNTNYLIGAGDPIAMADRRPVQLTVYANPIGKGGTLEVRPDYIRELWAAGKDAVS